MNGFAPYNGDEKGIDLPFISAIEELSDQRRALETEIKALEKAPRVKCDPHKIGVLAALQRKVHFLREMSEREVRALVDELDRNGLTEVGCALNELLLSMKVEQAPQASWMDGPPTYKPLDFDDEESETAPAISPLTKLQIKIAEAFALYGDKQAERDRQIGEVRMRLHPVQKRLRQPHEWANTEIIVERRCLRRPTRT